MGLGDWLPVRRLGKAERSALRRRLTLPLGERFRLHAWGETAS